MADYLSLEHIIRDMGTVETDGPVAVPCLAHIIRDMNETQGTSERRRIEATPRPVPDATDGTTERRKLDLVGRPKDVPSTVPMPASRASTLYRQGQIQSKIIDEDERPGDDVQVAIGKIKGNKGNPVDLKPMTDDRNNDNQRQDADSKKARSAANRSIGQPGESVKEEAIDELDKKTLTSYMRGASAEIRRDGIDSKRLTGHDLARKKAFPTPGSKVIPHTDEVRKRNALKNKNAAMWKSASKGGKHKEIRSEKWLGEVNLDEKKSLEARSVDPVTKANMNLHKPAFSKLISKVVGCSAKNEEVNAEEIMAEVWRAHGYSNATWTKPSRNFASATTQVHRTEKSTVLKALKRQTKAAKSGRKATGKLASSIAKAILGKKAAEPAVKKPKKPKAAKAAQPATKPAAATKHALPKAIVQRNIGGTP